MTKTATTERAFTEVLKHAESIRNDDAHRIEMMEPGDAWAQGDILIIRLASIPKGALKVKSESQLAPGNTQGSRHAIANLKGVTMYRLADPTPLDGPLFECKEPVITIDHPEHGACSFPSGIFAVRYQRAFAAELRRQLD